MFLFSSNVFWLFTGRFFLCGCSETKHECWCSQPPPILVLQNGSFCITTKTHRTGNRQIIFIFIFIFVKVTWPWMHRKFCWKTIFFGLFLWFYFHAAFKIFADTITVVMCHAETARASKSRFLIHWSKSEHPNNTLQPVPHCVVKDIC